MTPGQGCPKLEINIMNEIRRRFPNFIDVSEEDRTVHQFTTIADLETIDWIAQWKTTNNFKRFSKSADCLMAEIDGSDKNPFGSYWAIGFIKYPDLIDLPKWEESEPHRLRREAWNSGAKTFTYQGKEYKV